MTLLIDDDAIRDREAVATAELAPLARGLSAELAPLKDRELYLPREKALLSREGGRCSRDGSTLEFDPYSPDRHRCPTCGEIYTGELHHRFWVFWYQLWLAERAVHGALLGALLCDESAAALSRTILDRYADAYLLYPNRDNVLGPTRLFFSTYLESIWLLNLCVALDLLENRSTSLGALAARVRERIVEPSAELIASYDEGASNRQVWNDVALLAAGRLLRRDDIAERAVFGRSGIAFHLQSGLLADGSWYEGENYHLFAHRGLWYGVTMAEAARLMLPAPAVARFQEGFVAPFLTSLPDLTLPSRRDSQYAISLRQPRFAELCELGLAREAGEGDSRLRAMLHRLYDDDVPRRDIGRSNSTADVERNLPGTRLSRADLGWRSLLFGRPTLPPLTPAPLGSVLLEAQGIAVFRRAHERVYVALDYGSSGGGHGHPDRLNVLLSDGVTRWLDDMGTGSYVDPSLHWYRSTLAHNAPMFGVDDQRRVDGELLAFDERGDAGWVSACAMALAPGVVATRTLVLLPDYVLDELTWESDEPIVVQLPIHLDPTELTGVGGLVNATEAGSISDPLGVVEPISAHSLDAGAVARLLAQQDGHALHGCIVCSLGARLHRVSAPGAPGKARQPFLLLRIPAARGAHWVRAVWSWDGGFESVSTKRSQAFVVTRGDGRVDEHRRVDTGWVVRRIAGSRSDTVTLGGLRVVRAVGAEQPARPNAAHYELAAEHPLVVTLARESYRRSEESWEEAGRPSARVELRRLPNDVEIGIDIRKGGELTFVPAGAVNPYDNEAPDVNGDGVQLYLSDGLGSSGWVLVPEGDGARASPVRIRTIKEWTAPRLLRASWRRTTHGYFVDIQVRIAPPSKHRELNLGLVINEKPADRERRRGQLVLGGAREEFVYLRGDREELDRLPRIRVVD